MARPPAARLPGSAAAASLDSCAVSAAVPPTLVGQVLDRRYRVLSHIADGGMASVYVALDERLDREVALKVMRPSLAADETFVSRFRREARSAARLSHPNVVAVYDQGDDEGRMFLAMELRHRPHAARGDAGRGAADPARGARHPRRRCCRRWAPRTAPA